MSSVAASENHDDTGVHAPSKAAFTPGMRTPERGERFSDNGAGNDMAIPHQEPEEDPTTHELKYTADVGSQLPDGKAAPQTTNRADFINEPEYAADVRAAFAGVPKVKPQWQDRYLTILVVGESGLGKTTFIKNLMAAYAQDPDLPVNDAHGVQSAHDFAEQPERLCTSVTVNDHTTQTRFHYRVQDTPGHDSVEGHLDAMLEHVRGANQLCLHREQDAKRAGPLHRFEDPRVDAALYFIAPHCLRPTDIDNIAKLSELVPVVPVLAKADSMTSPELAEFRKCVREQLQHVGKGAGRDLLHAAFSAEALEEVRARRDAPPFAVVASTDMDISVGRFWPVRKYPWGTCEALSSAHSDLGALKRLLFEVGFEDLKAATESRYYSYRERELMHLDDPTLPIQRGTLAEHLQRTLHPRSQGFDLGVAAKKAGLWVAGGLALLLASNLALGGKERVRRDLSKLTDVAGEVGARVVDKAGDVSGAVADRAGEAGAAAAERAAALRDKLTGAEEEAHRKAEEERRRRARRGPFGIFGGRD